MSKASDALSFLRSFWGLLAVVSISFPGAAALFKIPVAVELSKISSLYPIVGGIVSAFALLLATTYRENFLNLSAARRWAVTSMAIAFFSFFAYVGVRIFLLDLAYEEQYVRKDGDEMYTFSKYQGIIRETVESTDKSITAIPSTKKESGDPWDILSLLFFTITFASLTVSFSVLGLHVYEIERTEKII
jgi:hypothetical protein